MWLSHFLWVQAVGAFASEAEMICNGRSIAGNNAGIANRHGFTLIELLVVIGIIGLLVAILLPAIQYARESSRRVLCQSNLRQIGLAVQFFEEVNGYLPSATYGRPYAEFKKGAPQGDISGSPFTHLLSFLEASSVADLYNWKEDWFADANQAAVNAKIPLFRCPSAAGRDIQRGLSKVAGGKINELDHTAAVIDYTTIYSWGFPWTVPADPFSRDIWGVGALGPMSEESQGFALPGAKYTLPKRKYTTDGGANTLIIVERAATTERWIGGARMEDAPISAREWAPWAGRGCTWLLSYVNGGRDYAPTGLGDCNVNCSNHQGIYAFHHNGANVLSLDGHVSFLREEVDARVLFALVTRSRGDFVEIEP